MFGVGLFKFDGDLKVGLDVDPLVDLPKSPLINFADNFVVLTYFLGHLRHASKR
jgi:hypothetical protein